MTGAIGGDEIERDETRAGKPCNNRVHVVLIDALRKKVRTGERAEATGQRP